jgi:NADH:ubiquinone oxidoreductase subunit F (NADH-binding)
MSPHATAASPYAAAPSPYQASADPFGSSPYVAELAAPTAFAPYPAEVLYPATGFFSTPAERAVPAFPGPADGMSLLDGVIRFSSEDRRPWDDTPYGDDLQSHRARYGDRPRTTGDAGAVLLETIEDVELTGRGGAHFPTARKWRSMISAGGGGVVVANGAEGEPGCAKDAALLLHRPHLVIDGLVGAAEALGAGRLVIWLHESATGSHRAVRAAVAERRAAGIVELPVEIATGPDTYLTGESSAVVRALSGGPALPRFARVPATTRGIDGQPTLVQNVETLARVALLARFGPDVPQPGPLVTVVSRRVLTVAELDLDADVALAASLAPDAASTAAQAVLIGGYGGRWREWSDIADAPLAYLDGRHAPSLGAGMIAVAPADLCGLAETAAVADYLARSSARQCGPCVNGTRELADTLLRIAAGRPHRGDAQAVEQVAALVAGRGGCRLPDAAAHLAVSAVATFADDLRAHLAGRPCAHASAAALLPVPGRAGPHVRPTRPGRP